MDKFEVAATINAPFQPRFETGGITTPLSRRQQELVRRKFHATGKPPPIKIKATEFPVNSYKIITINDKGEAQADPANDQNSPGGGQFQPVFWISEHPRQLGPVLGQIYFCLHAAYIDFILKPLPLRPAMGACTNCLLILMVHHDFIIPLDLQMALFRQPSGITQHSISPVFQVSPVSVGWIVQRAKNNDCGANFALNFHLAFPITFASNQKEV